MLGSIKRGTQIRVIKNHKRQSKPPRITSTRAPAIYFLDLEPKTRHARPHWPRAQIPSRPTPKGSDADTASPDPLGLGHKFRLARPVQGSGVKRRSSRTRLPTHGARTLDMTGAVTPISQQGTVVTIPTTLATVALPLSVCNLTSFTVVYCLTVKEEWGRLISVTVCCLLPLLTGQEAASPIRPPRLQQGLVTLHRSSHAVVHTSRTGWASSYMVGTVALPLGRRKSTITM